jgi:hypothetical protein
MGNASRKEFPHRHNRDGSFDSICPKCFVTVDTRDVEGQLQLAEKVHNCNGLNLSLKLHPPTETWRTRRYRPTASGK